MSQDSTNSLELMSQETYEVLQSLIGSGKPAEEFAAKYRIQPYDIQLANENNPENVEINIERLFSFPRVQSIKSEIDFNDSPPDLNISNSSIHYESPQKIVSSQQVRPITCTAVSHDMTTSSRQCFAPPNTNFPGPYNFTIGFQEEKGPPVKSAPWTYSAQLEKLFVKMKSVLPIRFKFSGNPPPGSYIKCVCVFQQPEYFKEVVERCIAHVTKFNDGHCAPKHLLRFENHNSKYETCPYTGRHTVMIPVREFEAGVNYFTEMIQYMCFNSCPGGMNRRSTNTIFSLEHNSGHVLGRKVLDTRICACPGRDRVSEENGEHKKVSKSSNNAQQPQSQVVSSCQETPPPTPAEDQTNHVTNSEAVPKDNNRPPLKRNATKITEGFQLQSLSAYKRIKREEDEEFTIRVYGREKYELLLKIKEGLDLMDIVPQSFLDNYRAGCPPCGPNWFIENQRKANEQNISNTQNNSDSEGTPPSTFPLSQLSRTSSNTSTRSNPDTEYSTVRFCLKRTVSLERKGLKRKEVEGSEKIDK